jgi:hypothetical protein
MVSTVYGGGNIFVDSVFIYEKRYTMGMRSLRKCAITTPQEIRGFRLTKQAEERGHEKYLHTPIFVIAIRWISIVFCLAFWYGVYTLFIS